MKGVSRTFGDFREQTKRLYELECEVGAEEVSSLRKVIAKGDFFARLAYQRLQKVWPSVVRSVVQLQGQGLPNLAIRFMSERT